jgi:hypothetical protein
MTHHDEHPVNHPDERPPANVSPKALPWAVGSVAVIAIGVLATYADVTVGAVIVLIGLIGFVRMAVLAARGVGDDS